MKYKKIMLILITAIFLVSIASASASDANDTLVASEDTNQMDLSSNNEITEDNLKTSEENTTLTQVNNAETDSQILSEGEGTYNDLRNEIGSGGDKNLTKSYYRYTGGDAIEITISGVINGNGAVIDMAESNIRAFNVSASGVTIKNLTIKNANYNGKGGAIYFSKFGTVTNCIFTNNQATGSLSGGGAVYFDNTGNVTNCNFIGNKATGDDSWGGAIAFWNEGSVTNCNFANNSAKSTAGAIYMKNDGNVTNCNFTDNSANTGGAVYFTNSGSVANCNFANNSAKITAGAISVDCGSVTNCNFTGNTANRYGGAIVLRGESTVTNCNFIKNTAPEQGGAISMFVGTATNCYFADNSAGNGGAIYSFYKATTADTCIFKTGSDTTFNADIFSPTLNVDNFTTFYDSGEKLTFDLKTNSSIRVTNGNISISVYSKDNNSWIGNYSCLSGEGWIPDLPVGSYYAIFDTEYAKFQPINRTITVLYYVNVTSLTTNNRTVNLTAKSNIPIDILEGKLLFILPDGDEIDVAYGGNGTWWAVHTFDEYGVYQVSPSNIGLDNVTITNGTITINKADSKITLENITLNYGESKNITITTEGATGITVKIDNVNVTVVNNFAVCISGLNVGNHTLAVSTVPDEDHISVTETATIIVNKHPTEIILYNETLDLKAMDIVHVSAMLTPAGIGNLTYVSSNVSVVTVDDKGNVEAIGGGNATITVSFAGNENYTAAKDAVVTVTVSKLDTAINVNPIVEENNVFIIAAIDKNAGGIVKFNISDKVAYVVVNGGEAVYGVILPVDNYTVETTYMGDNRFNSNRTSKEFTVSELVKENTPINLTVSSVENNATFTVGVNSNATGIVRFEISGTEDYTVYTDVLNGKAVLDVALEVGDYTVVATYMGDASFNSNITSESFTIKGHVKKDTPISADAKTNGNLVTITVDVDENATGFVSLKQSGSTVYAAVENGVATYVATFAPGSYNFEATYLGDDDYNENSTLLLFTVVEVAKENTTINVDVSSVENNATFTVDVNPDATGIVRFEVSGAEEYTVYADVLNGKAVMEDVLSVGDYTVVATYMGDDRFNSNVTSKTFNIKGHVKIDTPITANADVNGYKVTVTVEVNESATGFVNMKFDDTEFNVELNNGIGLLTVDLPANSYNVDVTYLGDYNFNENMTKLTFTVVDPVKENTPIEFDVTSIENNVTYVVNVNPDATGIVRFEVSGAEEYTVYADVLNGKAVMEDVLSVGDYEIVATYMGDARFNSNITSGSFTIRGHAKKDTPISADAKVNGNRVTITVNVNESAGGFVGLKMSGSTIYVAVENGAATYVATFAPGSYNAVATYLGDEDYNENSTRLLFTVVEVAKENTNIALDVSSVENNVTYTVDVNPDAGGIVRFEVTGAEEYTVYADVLNGKAVLDDVLSVGDYTVVATYMGDSRFNSNVTSKTFNIKGHVKMDTPINADVNVNGYRVTVTVEVNESATGFVNMKFDDTEFNVELNNGVGSLAVDLPAGSYNVDVTYRGDDNFNENMTKLTFTVVDPVKENTSIALNVSSVEDNATFTVNVNPDATGIVRFEVSGAEEYTVYADVLNGKAVMEDVLSVGDYTVVATYMGDDRFNSNLTSASFTIKGHVKKDTPISAVAKVTGNRVTITVNVNESAGGFVGLKMSGSTIYAVVENGVATYVTTFDTGSYNVAVTYLGDDNYNENSTRVLFTVVDAAKENTSIDLNVSSVEDYVTFTVTVDSDASGIVRFEVTGAEEYTVYADVLNGKAVMEDVLLSGNYTVVATYMGDDNFNSNTTLASFAVEKEPVIIPKASEFTDITIGDDLSIYIVLKDEDGNVIANAPITYTVNGTAGTTTTASDGSFTIKAASGAKVDINYAGNETFLPTNLTLTFNVPDVPVVVKTATHFDIKDRAITINGYAVDGPANEQGIYYATTLLDANGKPVSNVYIEFAVNNKIYNRTTYENGSFNPYKLNMIRAGRYTMAFNFAGDDNYTNAFACVCVDLDKKPITIKAPAKSYKVATKTKKYTVTLSTIKGLDGKMHLSPKKVTLKVNGKTYSAKTNSKGVALFKITNLNKKAKYKAVISYAGDKTYEAASKTVTLTVK